MFRRISPNLKTPLPPSSAATVVAVRDRTSRNRQPKGYALPLTHSPYTTYRRPPRTRRPANVSLNTHTHAGARLHTHTRTLQPAQRAELLWPCRSTRVPNFPLTLANHTVLPAPPPLRLSDKRRSLDRPGVRQGKGSKTHTRAPFRGLRMYLCEFYAFIRVAAGGAGSRSAPCSRYGGLRERERASECESSRARAMRPVRAKFSECDLGTKEVSSSLQHFALPGVVARHPSFRQHLLGWTLNPSRFQAANVLFFFCLASAHASEASICELWSLKAVEAKKKKSATNRTEHTHSQMDAQNLAIFFFLLLGVHPTHYLSCRFVLVYSASLLIRTTVVPLFCGGSTHTHKG